MYFERKHYLQQLINGQGNGMVKILTGIRRCGKSFLLFDIFRGYLLRNGVSDDHIICAQLDDLQYEELRDAHKLLDYVNSRIVHDGRVNFVLLDEVQMIDRFVELLLTLLHIKDLEIYVTGSNSKFLSSDVVTEFRGRGDEIRLHPLSVSECLQGNGLTFEETLKQYFVYGGLPQVVMQVDDERRQSFLKNIIQTTYIKDVVERNRLKNPDGINEVIRTIASSIGGFTNPKRIADTFRSTVHVNMAETTIRQYIGHLQNAFLISPATRYDIKGRRYIGAECKYYFEDVGVRNALLNFRQFEKTHIMENLIYNELCSRGFSVDVGMVELWERADCGRKNHSKIEIDFVVNRGAERVYIQSAYSIEDEAKRLQEIRPFRNVGDSFAKVLIVYDDIYSYHNEEGVLIMGLKSFLTNENVF
ncbi:MAG: ATP-binding protein [Paludibacteraceae bacterium]|nr:ATP-binding protein [Paludibacteraceae bacterium]